jgi:hypothetical protein
LNKRGGQGPCKDEHFLSIHLSMQTSRRNIEIGEEFKHLQTEVQNKIID